MLTQATRESPSPIFSLAVTRPQNNCIQFVSPPHILGKVHHISHILPFCSHLSIYLQVCISRYIIKTSRTPSIASFWCTLKAAWNSFNTVWINFSTSKALHYLSSILLSPDSATYIHPINLLIPKTLILYLNQMHATLPWEASNTPFNFNGTLGTLSLQASQIGLTPFSPLRDDTSTPTSLFLSSSTPFSPRWHSCAFRGPLPSSSPRHIASSSFWKQITHLSSVGYSIFPEQEKVI